MKQYQPSILLSIIALTSFSYLHAMEEGDYYRDESQSSSLLVNSSDFSVADLLRDNPHFQKMNDPNFLDLDAEYDHSFTDLVTPGAIANYQASLSQCTLDEKEMHMMNYQNLAADATAAGFGASALYQIANAASNITVRSVTRGPAQKMPLAIAATETFFSMAKLAVIPTVIIGSGAFIWHELKEKVRLEQEVKEKDIQLKTKDHRIDELTQAVHKGEDTVIAMRKTHEDDLHKLVTQDRANLIELDGILVPLSTNFDETKACNQCRNMRKVIEKKAIPFIAKACAGLKTIEDVLDHEQHKDNEERKHTWFKTPAWVKAVFDHCHFSHDHTVTPEDLHLNQNNQ
jgi:hypothetical protein